MPLNFQKTVKSVANKSKKLNEEDPKTPLSRKRRPHPEDTHLRASRQKEKQPNLQSKRSECNSQMFRRARSRINFKVVSPMRKRDFNRENNWHLANRVSCKNRPWAKKTVLFPIPLFQSTPAQQHKFYKTRSLIIPKTKQSPHKFFIKSTPSASKLKVKVKISPTTSVSPTSLATHSKKSLKMSAASKLRRSLSPSRLVSPLRSRRDLRHKDDDGTLRSTVHTRMSPRMSKSRWPFSPSRLATRLVSPLKRKKDYADEHGRRP